MTVPRRFIGAWAREHLEVDGRVVTGTGPAVWVEAGGTYVDVRGPGTIASDTSFGGRSTWRSPMFTWHHDVDLHPVPASLDRGELVVEGDRIVETGVGLTGDGASYEEHWHRLPTNSGVVIAVAHHAHGRAVRVGDFAAVVCAEPASARLWRRTDDSWSEWIALGASTALPIPLDTAWQLPRGWQLRT
jgi:hypothetical protein